MTERDAFETRFAAAYRAYLDGAPTDVDAGAVARVAAAAYPRARRITSILAFGPARTFAWFVILALMLAALGAAAVIVASRPGPRLPAIVAPVALAIDCPAGSTPDQPGPADQARPLGLAASTFDRRADVLVALAGPDGGVGETWTFDVCTNTWTQRHPSLEPSSAEAARLVYDVGSDLTVGVMGGRVWTYDLKADAWTRRGAAPTDSAQLAYDPISGHVIAATAGLAGEPRPAAIWSYDIGSDTWAAIRQADSPPILGDGAAFAYDASVDRLVAYALDGFGGKVWLFDLRTGTWSRSNAKTPSVFGFWGMARFPPAIVHAEAARRTVVSGGTGRSAAYDAAADRWELLSGSPDPERLWFSYGPMSRWSLDAYDSVNERLVGGGDAGGIRAFDPTTRRWTVLLEADPARGSPVDDSSGTGAAPSRRSAPDLEAMLPSNVDGVAFAKTSVAGGVPSTRLGKGGWGTVPLGSDDGLVPVLSVYGKTLADLDVAVATPTDASQADTFAVAFRVEGLDMTDFATDLADMSGLGPAETETVGGKPVQVFREVGGMGFDLYINGDVVFYVFTDGTPLIDGIVTALP